MSIIVCLPFTAFALLFAASCLKGNEWRVAAITTATFWGVAVAVITEVLSGFHALAVPGLVTAWLLLNVGAAWCLYRVKDRFGVYWREVTSKRRRANKGFALASGLVIALVGLTAVIYPPNTGDAMSYHMPRIVYWLHNHSVGFYATHELRQLSLQPWAEYAMAHLHALYGGDRLDNVVQWFGMAGSVIGVSLLAKMLGARPRGQVLAALLCATIPEGVLEGSAAKNDYVLSFWLVALTYYLLAFRRDRTLVNLVGIGSALGLACLTKATAFILAPPIILAVMLLWEWPESTIYLRYLFLAGIFALALNAGIFVRNYQLFGSPLGPSVAAPPNGFKYTNDQFGASVTASNLVRNVALHMGTSNTEVNSDIEMAIKRFFGVLGINVNDPHTTWDWTVFHVPAESRHEALAGNPLHCFLIFVTLFLLFWRRRTPELRSAFVLAVGLVAAFVLFCVVLRWQPWNTRLHLPFFVLWAAVTGTVLTRLWTRSTTNALGVLLLLAAVPDVFGNVIRPLAFSSGPSVLNQSRLNLYFNDRQNLMDPYVAAARYARAQGCSNIGFNIALDGFDKGFEYPLLVLLGDENGTRNVADVDVRNPSKVYAPSSSAPPCVVICPDCVADMPEWKSYAARFASVRVFDGVAVLTTGPATVEEGCSVSFKGWYGQERAGPDWWRWSSGTGEVHIFVSQDRDITLDGAMSSVQPPNTIHVLLDGQDKTQIQTLNAAPSAFQGISLHLPKGDHAVEFVSNKPGTRIPGDGRLLAIAIRNLRVETPGDARYSEPAGRPQHEPRCHLTNSQVSIAITVSRAIGRSAVRRRLWTAMDTFPPATSRFAMGRSRVGLGPWPNCTVGPVSSAQPLACGQWRVQTAPADLKAVRHADKVKSWYLSASIRSGSSGLPA